MPLLSLQMILEVFADKHKGLQGTIFNVVIASCMCILLGGLQSVKFICTFTTKDFCMEKPEDIWGAGSALGVVLSMLIYVGV